MCQFHQTSPESHFTKGHICSKLTPDGRTTISRGRLIVTQGDTKEERELKPEEVDEALSIYFGIVM
jgi:N-hydroxyarylamine O-acetyltransferase